MSQKRAAVPPAPATESPGCLWLPSQPAGGPSEAFGGSTRNAHSTQTPGARGRGCTASPSQLCPPPPGQASSWPPTLVCFGPQLARLRDSSWHCAQELLLVVLGVQPVYREHSPHRALHGPVSTGDTPSSRPGGRPSLSCHIPLWLGGVSWNGRSVLGPACDPPSVQVSEHCGRAAPVELLQDPSGDRKLWTQAPRLRHR